MKTSPHHPHRLHSNSSLRYSAVVLLATSLGLAPVLTQGSTGAERSASSPASRDADDNDALKRSDKKFVTKVAESTPKELAMAQLAVQRASDPQVKRYAQQIISDHQQMSQQLLELAQQKGIVLKNADQLAVPASAAGSGSPTALASDITSDRHYRSLSQKTGAEFDQEFVAAMVDDHKKDLKLFQKEAEDAEDSAVRAFASQNVPVLQKHLDRAQALNRSVAE